MRGEKEIRMEIAPMKREGQVGDRRRETKVRRGTKEGEGREGGERGKGVERGEGGERGEGARNVISVRMRCAK